MTNENSLKYCFKCKQLKDKDNFFYSIIYKSNRRPYCKECEQEVSLVSKQRRIEMNKALWPSVQEKVYSEDKECKRCKKTKKGREFYKDLSNLGFLRPYCKKCDREANRNSKLKKLA